MPFGRSRIVARISSIFAMLLIISLLILLTSSEARERAQAVEHVTLSSPRKFWMASFLHFFAKKVTAKICPVELLVMCVIEQYIHDTTNYCDY